MSLIHILGDDVCNRIAAGEVVERPASVVKELIENSIDAGAKHVSVVIEKAGLRMIRVTDDGSGMDADDALLCIEPHATSKIRTEQDIFSISSFGFRGEAIPSIAAVSRFSLRTRKRDTEEGILLEVKGGSAFTPSPAGCAPGTEVTVRDLFFNVPARRKFVKSDATEERHVINVVSSIALAHPDVYFELKSDGRDVIKSAGASDLMPRIRDFFGRDLADHLTRVAKTENGIKVTGFVSARSYTRASRSDQKTFVNGRCVESAAIYRGIKEGYGPLTERGRYPAAIIFVTLPPELVDVNVHPAKREIRFRREFDVISAVRSAITSAVRTSDPVTGTFLDGNVCGVPDTGAEKFFYSDFTPGEGADAAACDAPQKSVPEKKCDFENTLKRSHGVSDLDRIMSAAKVCYEPRASWGKPYARQEQTVLPFEGERKPDADAAQNFSLEREDARGASPSFGPEQLKILGVVANSYVVCAAPDGLVLIDQHAAHERVMFEKILSGIDGTLSQKLLIPVTVELSVADMNFVTANAKEFEKIGFEIDPFGDRTIKLGAIPAAMEPDKAEKIFVDTLSRIAESGSSLRSSTEEIATAACKAAVKAHDVLTMTECQALIDQMKKCSMPFACPHGRPTVIKLDLNEIERRFNRK